MAETRNHRPILIVEDDRNIAVPVEQNRARQGFVVLRAADGSGARALGVSVGPGPIDGDPRC
jgi:DNA-binding response OmpR family regulator